MPTLISKMMSNPDKGEGFFALIIDAIKESFSVEYGEYNNLGLTTVSMNRIRVVVIAFFIGVLVAIYLSVFNRKVYGLFISALGAEGCFSPEKAKTLAELGFERDAAVRSAIRGGNKYKGVLRCVGQDIHNEEVERKRGEFNARAAAGEPEPGQSGAVRPSSFKAVPYRFDFGTDRFYIPEDKAFEANSKFEARRGGILLAVIATLVIIAALYVSLLLLPDIMQLLDNAAGIIIGSARG